MANYESVYGSGKHLKAEDLKGRTYKLIIKDIDIADFKESGKKLVLSFDGKEKGLVLNKTNARIVGKYYTPDYDNWKGKEIEIFPTETEFNGQLVPCIRVRIEAPKAVGQDFDDDIPF